MAENMPPNLDDNYWSNRYTTHQTGWDIGMASTPIKTYIDQLEDKNIQILIPGCGNAWEALYLFDNGFKHVTLIDISSVLVNDIRKKFINTGYQVIHGDFFQHHNKYDLVLEQTFFCALHPAYRIEYVKHMYEILNPGGKLSGVLFNTYFDHGMNRPPFGGTMAEYDELFRHYFKTYNIEICHNSINPRMGTEVWISVSKSL